MVCLCSSVLLGSKLFLGGGHLQYICMDVLLGVEYGGKNTSEGEQGRQKESEKVRWKESKIKDAVGGSNGLTKT